VNFIVWNYAWSFHTGRWVIIFKGVNREVRVLYICNIMLNIVATLGISINKKYKSFT